MRNNKKTHDAFGTLTRDLYEVLKLHRRLLATYQNTDKGRSMRALLEGRLAAVKAKIRGLNQERWQEAWSMALRWGMKDFKKLTLTEMRNAERDLATVRRVHPGSEQCNTTLPRANTVGLEGGGREGRGEQSTPVGGVAREERGDSRGQGGGVLPQANTSGLKGGEEQSSPMVEPDGKEEPPRQQRSRSFASLFATPLVESVADAEKGKLSVRILKKGLKGPVDKKKSS